MDSATLIVSALTTGATLMLQSALKEAAKDAYQEIKRRLQKRYADKRDLTDAVRQLEAKPDSPGRQAVLAEELQASGAAQDETLIRLAQTLLELTGSTGSTVVSATNHSVAVGGNVTNSKISIH